MEAQLSIDPQLAVQKSPGRQPMNRRNTNTNQPEVQSTPSTNRRNANTNQPEVQSTPSTNRRNANTNQPEVQSTPSIEDDFETSFELAALEPTARSSSSGKDVAMTIDAGQDVNKLSMFQSVEAYVEQLTQLSLRILRLERGLFATTMPLSIASPCFDDMYGATTSLINLINQYTDVNAAPVSLFGTKPLDLSDFDPNDAGIFFNVVNASITETNWSTRSIAIGSDPGVVLLILACHQRLLSLFERICSSVYQELQDLQSGSLEHFFRRQDPPHNSQLSTVSTTGQAVMAIQLVNHLLGRLDRALSPLSQYNTQPPGLLTTLSDCGLSSSNSYASDFEKFTSSVEEMLEVTENASRRHENEQSHGYNVAKNALDMLHRRHDQLQEHINTIKQTIDKSGDI